MALPAPMPSRTGSCTGEDDSAEAVLVDGPVRRALGELTDLAPLHQPKSLAALDAVSAALPGLPAVACFDTAFHASLPPSASTYALPAAWRQRWGLRRYGFHGLSHSWIVRRVLELVPDPVHTATDHLLPPRRRRLVVRDPRRRLG